MLKQLQAFVSNGQAVGAVTALVIAIFGVLVVTGTVKQSPDVTFVGSVVTVAFTATGLVLSYIQNSQHQQKIALSAALAQQAVAHSQDLQHTALSLGISLPELVDKLSGTAKAAPAPAPAPTDPASPTATQ
jgi:low affinity Fe/Cu permease